MRISSKFVFVAAGAVVVYALIYADVVSRAKGAYLEGERYSDWNSHPEIKKKFFEDRFAEGILELQSLKSKNKISEDEFKDKSESLEFEKNFNLEESSLKYAYQWYKDAYELFSPPESKWVRLARQKAPQTLELWKQELRSKNIPFEDYMFE